jgi:hypothetical protein
LIIARPHSLKFVIATGRANYANAAFSLLIYWDNSCSICGQDSLLTGMRVTAAALMTLLLFIAIG